MSDPYAMPSGVLRNKLRIVDPALLAMAEADITRAESLRLAIRPLPGSYDEVTAERNARSSAS